MSQALTKTELKAVIQKSVQEALAIELMKLRALLVPSVTKLEQQDIEKRYGKPTRRAIDTTRLRV